MLISGKHVSGCLVAWLVLQASPALAYIDPGSGTLLAQLLISGLFGGLFLARKWFRRVILLAGSLVGVTPSASRDRGQSHPD